MTRVLVAKGGAGLSGIGTYVRELESALAAAGHAVEVVAGPGGSRNGGTLGRLFPRTLARPSTDWLRQRIREARPDVVHIASPELGLGDLGVPTVWTAWHHPHDLMGRWSASLEMRSFGLRQVLWEMATAWVGYRLDDGALRHCDQVAAVSHRLAAALSERGWPASYVPPMISPSERHPPKMLPPVPRVVFSSANLGAPRKGLEFLVRAFEHLGGRVPLAVDFIGAPDARARELLRGSRIESVATIHGRTEPARAREIMAQANLLAMPSRSEEFGYVALEALALGLPVVAFDVPALDEIVSEDCGRRVAPLDAGALATALEEIVADEEGYTRLSAGATRRARAFSPEAGVPVLEALYRRAIEDR